MRDGIDVRASAMCHTSEKFAELQISHKNNKLIIDTILTQLIRHQIILIEMPAAGGKSE